MRSINLTAASLGLALISLVGCAADESGSAPVSKVSLDSLGDIAAPSGYSAELESLVGLPDSVRKGATYHLVARIRSNGEIPLVAGEDQLVPVGEARDAWQMGPVEITPAAGDAKSFFAEFDVIAPSAPVPLALGMVHGGGQGQQGYFGNRATGLGEMIGSPKPANFYDPGSSEYFATVVSSSIPSSVAGGSTFTVSITMQNTGTLPWSGSDFALRNYYYPDWGVDYVPLDANTVVNPGESHTFTFQATAPNVAGTHYMWWSMYSYTHGGFGYGAWRNVMVTGLPSGVSYTAESVPYAWDSSADAPSGTSTGLHCDDCSLTVNTPPDFSFNYYGNPVSSFALGSNGFISASGPYSWWVNESFPTTAKSLIAPWWDDLVLWPADADLRYAVAGDAPNRRLVVTWTNVDFYGWSQNPTNFGNMQAILFEGSNEIVFQYDTITNPGPNGGPTVGINLGNGIDATSIPATDIGAGGYAVKFTPN